MLDLIGVNHACRLDPSCALCCLRWQMELPKNYASFLQHHGGSGVHGVGLIVDDLFDACLDDLNGTAEAWAPE